MTQETDKQEIDGSVKDTDPKKNFVLGTVGAPFGLKGFVKVKSFSGETFHFSRLKKVTLRLGERETIRDVAEILFQAASTGNSLLMRFAGIDSPEAASSLKGAEIIAGREYAAPLKEGEYYVEDLKGLDVVNPEGKLLGKIANIVEGGGGELVEVIIPSGEAKLAPFRNEFFGDVDITGGSIILLEPWILE